MATIYLADEVLAELDKQVDKHNETNAATDRSGYIEHILKERKKK